MTEPSRVLAVPTGSLALGTGFWRAAPGLVLGPLRWIPRDAHDGSESREVICYCVFRRGLDVWAYRRHPSGGEPGLHGLVSVGVGGHVEEVDRQMAQCDSLWPIVASALWREVHEEVAFAYPGNRLASPLAPRADLPAGMLIDADTEVGRRHLGLVYFWDLPLDLDVRARDGAIEPLGWQTPRQLGDRLIIGEGYEAWSARVVEALLGLTDEAHAGTVAGAADPGGPDTSQ